MRPPAPGITLAQTIHRLVGIANPLRAHATDLRGSRTRRYVDYMHIDKGRDVQFDGGLGFESKISGGTAVFALSRDFRRLMRTPLCYFHKVLAPNAGM